MNRRQTGLAFSILIACATGTRASAGPPTDLLRGEAPLLFTGAEGEDADATLLRDGQAIRGDEIWLWVPAITAGEVDLSITGQFFKIWDSGPEAGPDGNDDDDNGMRGMDFDPSTSTFLISYEDTTTTGFAFGGIKDGDLMELTPTVLTNGFITGFTWTRLYNEGLNGEDGNIGTGDINAILRSADGTLFIGSGKQQTIVTDVPGTLIVHTSTLMHLDPTAQSGSPENIGPDKFFEVGLNGVPVIFAPAIYAGRLSGVDILDDGLVTFGTSDNYKNTVFTGPIDGLSDEEAEALAINVEVVCLEADICSVPDLLDDSLNTYQQRTAEVLYSGDLFFESPNIGFSGLLDHDILDTPAEILALINLLGAGTDAGLALAEFVDDIPATCGGVAGDGDANQDGQVNGRDVDTFLAIMLNGAFAVGTPEFCAADTNPDDSVDAGDLDSFVLALLN